MKNMDLDVLVEDLSPQAQGVAKADGFVVFVPGGLPGERWRVKIIKVTAQYAVGRPLKRLGKPWAYRAEPPCPLAKSCGGCQLQHIAYSQQLELKEKMLTDCLKRIGGIQAPPVRPIVGMEAPWRYRNKGLFPFSAGPEGICAGLYAERSHRVIAAGDCLIQHESAVSVMRETVAWAREKGIPVYDETHHEGVLRHVMGRTTTLGETMAVIVTRTRQLPHAQSLVDRLRQNIPGLVSVYHNINEQRTNVALGPENRLIWGKPALQEQLGPVSFMLSPQSFFQVNPVQTVKLYDLAAEAADLQPGQVLYDAYCGVGTIGQYLAYGKDVSLYGVEVVEQAVADAQANAARNGLEKAQYVAGAAEEVFPRWVASGARPDVVVVDPPRKGCHPAFLEALCSTGAPRIVYVSCNPATLARDAALIMQAGYSLAWARPVDMFPHTTGVETVVLLSKLNTKQHIEVELNLDELDLTAAESKATYDEIKAYVLEKHGLKVSSLYISQVKRKCGLDVGQNYNLSKKENAKVPQCPPEKEAAIMEALKHFQMI